MGQLASWWKRLGYELASTTTQIGLAEVRFTQNVFTHASACGRFAGTELEQYKKALGWQEWAASAKTPQEARSAEQKPPRERGF